MSAVTFSLETSSTVRQLIFLVGSVTLKELEEICDVTRSQYSRPHNVRIIQRGSAKPRAISSDDHRQILHCLTVFFQTRTYFPDYRRKLLIKNGNCACG